MNRLDDLFAALADLADSRGEMKATSIRQPAALHRAAQFATELGMDESFTAAANRALEERTAGSRGNRLSPPTSPDFRMIGRGWQQ